MDGKAEESIRKAYVLINKNVPQSTQIDSLEVVKQVEEYRQFWKPEKVNVALLAESHVYTDNVDFKIKLKKTILDRIIPNYPSRFVRFVYCLGYGENELLERTRTERKNSGTPQFWKIFSSCIAEKENNLDFQRVLKRGTPSFPQRLQNKATILQQMKEKGIWLLDASIVGLYGNGLKRGSSEYRTIIRLCWDNYVARIFENAHPEYVIVIGKGVEKALMSRLKLPYEVIDLPQAHLSSHKQMENYKRYNEICNDIVKGKTVTERKTTIVKKSIKDIGVTIGNTRSVKTTTANVAEEKLVSLGYTKTSNKKWTKGNRTVNIVTSSDFGQRMRITWKEKWKNDHAIIYDYSKTKGPICIIPIAVIFNSRFIKEKRISEAYANSGYWWTQPFQREHELSKLVLSFQRRWDIL